jgi:phosphatidylserine/phosphatidylglycerophosphate/cardiolipin synthase-like enzyme
LLIIDGKIGFIGGAGIADLWSGTADSPEHWRDNPLQSHRPSRRATSGQLYDKLAEDARDRLAWIGLFPAARQQRPFVFVSVGSGNFDNRSIRLNDEANLDVLDRQFAAEQTRLFEMDKRHAREVTVDELGGLHFANPLEQVAGLFAPQL